MDAAPPPPPPPPPPPKWTASALTNARAFVRRAATALQTDVALALWVALYVVTGAVSPTLIDYLAHTGGTGDAAMLLPVLCTAAGMASVVPFTAAMQRLVVMSGGSVASDAPAPSALAGTGGGKTSPTLYHERKSQLPLSVAATATAAASASAAMWRLAVLDVVSTSLVTIGLLDVGSATYTVVYSSAVAWTALISSYRGKKLTRSQVVGVVCVTSGLVLNGLGHWIDDQARTEAGVVIFVSACVCLLIGTISHSFVMILIDESSHTAGALGVASSMGRCEVALLVTWNFVLRSLGFGHLPPLKAMPMLGALVVNQMLHSVAFFSMIGRLGAVGSAVLKGFLALCVFGLAAALFCDGDHSEQCLSPLKSVSMLFVFVGGVVFGLASSSHAARKRSGQPPPSLSRHGSGYAPQHHQHHHHNNNNHHVSWAPSAMRVRALPSPHDFGGGGSDASDKV